MKNLLQAALRNSRHFTLAVLTLVTLFLVTIANQMEMCALGVMANTGADFFTIFGKEKKHRLHATDSVSFDVIKEKWAEIDPDNTGKITKQQAMRYLSTKKDANPLNMALRKISLGFDLERNFSTLLFVLIFVAIFKAISLFSSRYTTQVLSIRVTRDLRQQYFEHIQSQPMGFYHEYNLGSLTSRAVGDAGQIASSLNSCITNYLQTPFTIITTLCMCFYISWKLSLVIFLGLPMVICPIVFLTKRVKRVTRQLQKNQEAFTSVLLDFLSGIHTVKVFAMEAFSLKKFKEQNDEMAMLESKSAKYGLLTRPVLHTITTACLAIVVLFGLYTLRMTIAQLIVFCGLLHLFYEPVKKFAEETANIQKGLVAAERMFEVLNLKPSIQDNDGAIELKSFKEKIVFDNVWFKYGEDWVLKDLSFTATKGETIAIVGPTGAGKSTIVQLLPRLYDPQKGDIYIDGLSLRAYQLRSLRETIAFVPQKPFLFLDTVAENIAYGRDFTREEVIEAAKKAHAHEFIVDLRYGYDTVLSETGKSLSGGQQQRLAIARALVKKAPVLVMDEATSSLDAISEKKIKSAISELRGHITQVIIAHRLSTIEHADKIIYLENGMKIAEGKKDKLLKICPSFRLMWETFHQIEEKETSINVMT